MKNIVAVHAKITDAAIANEIICAKLISVKITIFKKFIFN